LFHARGPAAAKDRSPTDDIARGTATELDAADLRPGLVVGWLVFGCHARALWPNGAS